MKKRLFILSILLTVILTAASVCADDFLNEDYYRASDSAGDSSLPDSGLRVGENSGLPDWYPKDPAAFPDYHDDTAPRVVDRADLFSSGEEAVMENRLAVIRQELSKDIVIYTDLSAYGMDHKILAADFFDFNGYGIGEDYEGVCLFICMDPNDRGWWVCCTGPETMALYTEDAANDIDDLLYSYMSAGDYYEGVSDWIENFRRLYRTGSPYTPEWADLVGSPGFERYHNEDSPRVIDEARVLSGEEIAQLEKKAAELSATYGQDIVIHTARNEGVLDREEYSGLYFYYNGYGYGENYDGLLLNVFKRPGYKGKSRVFASGSASEKLTDTNRKRLCHYCDDLLYDGEYYAAIDRWLDQSAHMLRTGRAPRTASFWRGVIAAELLIGLIFAAASLSKARRKMASPAVEERADRYIVPGSLAVRKIRNTHVGTSTTRTYSPVSKDDSRSGGSSSRRSSYSRSYSGSSGRTHSGSGRRF